MLGERDLQLLTAFVDGELTSRQRRLVERLLQRSADARELLQKLQDDARRLGNLPVPPLGRDLSAAILGAIGSGRLTPVRTSLPRAGHFPAWATLAAAALLIGLGLASFLYFSSSLNRGHAPAVAKQEPPAPGRTTNPGAQPLKNATPRVAIAKGSATRPPDNPRQGTPPSPARGPDTPPLEPVEVLPRPEEARDKDVFTDRMEMFQMDQVEFTLPVLFKVHQLDQDTLRSELVAELRKDRDFRLELPCRAGTPAFQRLQIACRALGVALVIDPAAQERLKMPQLAASYAVYMENISPEDLARLLQRAGLDDKRLAGRKPLEIQFDRLVLARMTPRDRKELSVLLGVDPTQGGVPPGGSLGTDPRQPLPDLTARQVAESLAGQGGKPRPEPGKPSARPGDNSGLVVIFNPARVHPGSAEIKRYLEGRKAARPGTLRVLLVLRG
jgi:hypothetical protein